MSHQNPSKAQSKTGPESTTDPVFCKRHYCEEDKHWVAANARYLAKVALEGYRGALEAA